MKKKYKKGRRFESAEELVRHLVQGLPYYWADGEDEQFCDISFGVDYYDIIEDCLRYNIYHAEEIKEREFVSLGDKITAIEHIISDIKADLSAKAVTSGQ